jgi:hypothetical protein
MSADQKEWGTLVGGAIAKGARILRGGASSPMEVVWRQIPGKKFVAVVVGFDSSTDRNSIFNIQAQPECSDWHMFTVSVY